MQELNGCGKIWLIRLAWDEETARSNRVTRKVYVVWWVNPETHLFYNLVAQRFSSFQDYLWKVNLQSVGTTC